MSRAGFFEQKRGSPTGLALVVTAHAAVLGALVLIKGPEIIRPDNGPLVIRTIRVPPDPPANPPPEARELRPETTFTRPRQEVELRDAAGPTGPTTEAGPIPDPGPVAEPIRLARIETITPAIRRDAQILSGNLQPPYPAAEQRAERGGTRPPAGHDRPGRPGDLGRAAVGDQRRLLERDPSARRCRAGASGRRRSTAARSKAAR